MVNKDVELCLDGGLIGVLAYLAIGRAFDSGFNFLFTRGTIKNLINVFSKDL